MNSPELITTHFEATASTHADRTAIRSVSGDITYRQLNASSNRIAHATLDACKMSPQRVALLFDQGVDSIASTLAVLKTGAAFVPLDATDGSERIYRVIEDCQPSALLTSKAYLPMAVKLAGGAFPVLAVDTIPESTPSCALQRSIPPDAAGSIFYTSGSTGIPKGVCQTQRNLRHFAMVYAKQLGVTEEDRLSFLYSPAFSASNMDIFSSLLSGATLFPYDIRKRGTAGLADWIDAMKITVLHAVPTVFRHLAQSLPNGRKLATIRAIDLGGEAVYPSDVELFRDHFRSDAWFINHLAATEASVIAQYRIDRSDSEGHSTIPVGYPAEGMRVRIIRTDGTEATDGEPGEILLSSPYLCTGYFRRPELNDQVFGDDSEEPGSRTMRSGDLGYWDARHRLCFLGRNDHREKVRGHSVDLSEVEAALGAREDVRDVAVVLDRSPQRDEGGQLVMIVARKPGYHPNPGDLRETLKRKLPDYMMPARYLVLDQMPTTTSGKIDRQELKSLAAQAMPVVASSERRLNEVESKVAELFVSILNLPSVGPSDHFFALGGDSLRATQLHLRLEEVFMKPLALESVLLDPTVQGIAAAVAPATIPIGASLESVATDNSKDSGGTTAASGASRSARTLPPVLVPLRDTGSRIPLFLVHGRLGQAFVSLHFLRSLEEDQPVYSFQAVGLDRKRGEHRSIPKIAATYIQAMRSIQPSGPYSVGSLCNGAAIATEMARQLKLEGEQVTPLLLLDPPDIQRRKRFKLRRFLRQAFPIYLDRFLRIFMKRQSEMKARKFFLSREETSKADDAFIQAALQSSDFLQIALLKHFPPSHEDLVLRICSEDRQDCVGNPDRLRGSLFQGEVKSFVVGETHRDVLAPGNERFSEALRECMEVIYRHQQMHSLTSEPKES
jgi:amino acid adenylation domain-containing protein